MATMANALGGYTLDDIITGQGTMAGYYPAQTVWGSWNNQFLQTATSTVTQTVWVSWNQQAFGQTAQGMQFQQQPSDVEIASATEALRKHEAAKTRAKELLLESLTPTQRETYEKHLMFIVETPKKNRYRLHLSQAPRKLSGEKDAVSYCIHTHGLPREDELLGFKLLLEANEDEFLRTANATALAA